MSYASPPLVTVLIAAYNAAVSLERAVDSALRQTAVDLEVLIVDDGSTDGTSAEMKRLASRDHRIRLLHLPSNGGPSAARNAGLDAAKGDWIVVLDADDSILCHRIQHLLSVATEHNADVVVDNFRFYDPATQTISRPALRESDRPEVVTLETFVARAAPFGEEPDWGLLKPVFRKRFLDECNLRYPTYSRHGEDFLLIVELFLKGGRYVLTRSAGYVYTTRTSGLSRTTMDYPLMRDHTIALMTDSRVAVNLTLVKHLRNRAGAINNLILQDVLFGYLKEREYVSILRRLIVDKSFRTMITAKGRWHFRKLRRMLRDGRI